MNSEKDRVILWLLGIFILTTLIILSLPLMFTYAVEGGVAIGREIK